MRHAPAIIACVLAFLAGYAAGTLLDEHEAPRVWRVVDVEADLWAALGH